VRSSKIDVATIVSVQFQQNTYVARREGRNDCLVFDPGLEPEKIVAYLHKHELEPAAILNTHGHADHIGGNAALKKRWPDTPLVIGARDAIKLTDAGENLSAAFGMGIVSPPAEATVTEGDIYQAAGFDLAVREIPGHSIGHVVFVWSDHQPPVAFVGDVIFAGSIGRTDFPDGDFRQLISGIHEKLFTLPDETVLLSGHGPPTTVGEEKRTNPFAALADED
jgi:glyoxylase-like metal-dependent hydrolase (beta-lactamase superfamily II)